jgi:hypothetical protein
MRSISMAPPSLSLSSSRVGPALVMFSVTSASHPLRPSVVNPAQNALPQDPPIAAAQGPSDLGPEVRPQKENPPNSSTSTTLLTLRSRPNEEPA